MKCIGATTFTEYRGIFEKDAALSRRFQKVDVAEPSVEQTIEILKGLKSRFEEHHSVKYALGALQAAAELSAKFNYILCVSRFAHYLKVMARDKIGSFMEVKDCERWLNDWIKNYVVENPENVTDELKAKYPLREAKVEVKEIPGKPGSYNAVAYLRPWLQMEELTASLRLVARIPSKAG